MKRTLEENSPQRQLALEIELDVAATFDGFFAESGNEVVAALRQLSAGIASTPLWICGPDGCGKSHLLQAVCRAVSERGGRAMYLPLSDRSRYEPEILQGCENMTLLALDDVDAIAGSAVWESAVFTAVNEFMLNAAPLVLAARAAPREIDFGLADLRSRARAHVVYRLPALSDESLEIVVQQRARDRGLTMDVGTTRYLLRRVPRDMRALDTWLARLDRASLASHRRITVALVRAVLAEFADETY